MKQDKLLTVTGVFTLLLVLIFVPFFTVNANSATSKNLLSLQALSAEEINVSNIRNFVRTFTSFKSRVDGYPGNYKAGNLIANFFRSLGLKVVVQNYSAAIPYDSGSQIIIEHGNSSIKIPAYALWPNGVQPSFTPRTGLSGKLIYVKDGDLNEFDGKAINNTIVLINFNSGSNWINAAKLGAKAIIFLANNETNSYEALTKATPVPIYVPRLLVNGNFSNLLLSYANNQSEVTVYSNINWKNITGRNIIGILNGTEYPNDVIVITAHYDSWSITPALAPGAEDSLSISSLLEIARLFSTHRPKRTIWFVALSGYWEGLIGPSNFVETNLFDKNNGKVFKIWLTLDLSISSQTSKLDAVYMGYWNNFWSDSAARASLYLSWFEPKAESYLSQAGFDPNIIRYNFRGSFDWGTQSVPYISVVELVSQTGSIGVSFRTQYSTNSHYFSFIDDEPFIEWSNIVPQVSAIYTIIKGFANDPNWQLDWAQVSPQRMKLTSGGFVSYITLNGKVVEFNVTKGWYTPVSNALVRMYTPSTRDSYLYWPFLSRYIFSNESGSFTFFGLLPYYGWGFDAWKFNEANSNIEYAVDNGMYGTATGISGGISNTASPLGHPWQVLLPVFKCTTITLFDVINPQTFSRAQIPDVRSLGSFKSLSFSVSVYDFGSKSIPVFYGSYLAPAYDQAVIFVKPGSRVTIALSGQPVAGYQQVSFPLTVLVNNTVSNPEGFGYLVKDPLTITFTALKAAKEMYILTDYRYNLLKIHNAVSPGAELLLNYSKEFLSNALKYYAKKNYSLSYSYALMALSSISTAYSMQVMPTFRDASTSILFFGFLLLPFSIVFESLVFHSSGIKKVILISATFVSILFIFYMIHPAFSIITNSTISLVGAGLAIFATLSILLFIGKINDLLRSISERYVGVHEVGKETTAAVIHSLLTSTENMRRRKLFTSLTLGIIITVAVANTALTSTSIGIGTSATTVYGTNILPQNKILIKSSYALPPNILDYYLLSIANLDKGKIVASPRVWYYPQAVYPLGCAPPIIAHGKNLTVPIVFLGLSDSEANSILKNIIISGSTVFASSKSAIISSQVADSLDLKIGDKFKVLGLPEGFEVVGIFNSSAQFQFDVDGLSLLPINQRYSGVISRGTVVAPSGTQLPQSESPGFVVVVPWETAYKLGGYIASVSFLFNSTSYEELFSMANTIAINTFWSPFVGYDGKAFGIVRIPTFIFLGYTFLIPIFIISAIEIVNAYISNVKSRIRDIYVYSAVGLSPIGISLMFISESLIYALIGVVVGYVLGFAFNQLFISFGMLPKTFSFNFSSFFVLVSLFLIIVASFIGSIYPSIIAARMITPSLERRWKIPTKPEKDVWEIPMPFRIPSKEEGIGILKYLSEFFRELGYQRPGYRVYEPPVLSNDLKTLRMVVNLIPIEHGISQEAQLELIELEDKTYSFILRLRRRSGDPKVWQANNYYFIDDLRKQLLLWRSLKEEAKKKYLV
ncbi:MAG: M28 family peptidase [Thermoproteota archaeon]